MGGSGSGATQDHLLLDQGLEGLKHQAAGSCTKSWLPQEDGEGFGGPAAQDLPGTDLAEGGGLGPTELRAILGA